jgi:hypothetical protein
MLFFAMFLLFFVLSFISIIAPSVVIGWSKLQTKRRVYAFLFSFSISGICFCIMILTIVGIDGLGVFILCFFLFSLFITLKALRVDSPSEVKFPDTTTTPLFTNDFLSDHKKIWHRWSGVHKMASQMTRQKRAYGCYVKKIDAQKATAQFLGRDADIYQTTLIDCTCRDFERQETPCKHMYRLAKELGLIQLPEFQPGEEDYTLD